MAISDGGPAVDASQHLRLAYKTANRFRRWARRARVPMDEIEAEAMLGLVKAAVAYDPESGVRFSTFATVTVSGHLKNLLTRRRPLRQLPVGGGGESMDFAATPERDDTGRRELLGAVRKALPAREALVVELRFGLAGDDPLPLEEVGSRLGIGRERVRQLERKALKRLRMSRALRRLAEGVAGPVAARRP